nr:MAG TPA: hypothetical protein [Bacteriophage sp.]
MNRLRTRMSVFPLPIQITISWCLLSMFQGSLLLVYLLRKVRSNASLCPLPFHPG